MLLSRHMCVRSATVDGRTLLLYLRVIKYFNEPTTIVSRFLFIFSVVTYMYFTREEYSNDMLYPNYICTRIIICNIIFAYTYIR